MSHIGIEIRATINGLPILVCDSDWLHLVNKFSAVPQCGPCCLPGCQEHGWQDLYLPPGTRVEVRPVVLSDDPYPDET